MSVVVDPMRAPGRWLVTTTSGVMHPIESAGPDRAVTVTRATAGPAGRPLVTGDGGLGATADPSVPDEDDTANGGDSDERTR
jgi:hypothetical protein